MNKRKLLAQDIAISIRYFNDAATTPEEFRQNMLHDTPEIVGRAASRIPYYPTSDECGIVEWAEKLTKLLAVLMFPYGKIVKDW